MLWRWRHKLTAIFPRFPFKLESLAAAHHFSLPINFTTDSRKPQNPISFKSFGRQANPKQTPKITPQIVQATLQDCPSDIVALYYFLWCAQQPHYFHDKPAFRHMVTVVSNLTNRYGNVKGIVQALETLSCAKKAQTFLLLMRIYWLGDMYEMVFQAFEEMSRCGYLPNTYARNIIMDVSFRIGRVDVGLKFLQETETPNFLSFNIAVCNLCRLGEAVKVKVVLRSMLMKGYYLNPETYQSVLDCLCKSNKLSEASQLVGMMVVLGLPISVNIWTILIESLCKSGDIEAVSYVLDKMIESGCSPNIVTCTSLIKTFLKYNMTDKALKILDKAFGILDTLESRGCYPDLILCNVLIDRLSKMGLYSHAFKVFLGLRKRGIMPDAYTFSSLISTICRSRQYGLLPLLTSGLDIKLDLVVCNSLIVYFSKCGDSESALEFYNSMSYKGFMPDKYSHAGVLSALCRLGRIKDAYDVYNGMVRKHLDLDCYAHTIIINGLIRSSSSRLLKSGRFHGALRLFKQIVATRKFDCDIVLYNAVIDGFIGEGRLEEAYDLFSEMKQMNIAPDVRSYNLMLSGCCKSGDSGMLKRIWEEMVDLNVELDRKTFLLLRNTGYLPQADSDIVYSDDGQDLTETSTSSSDDPADAAVSVG